ncbi:hypothetical protein C0J52_19165 [Blattella germanica]|nr:hypothetical protein C0J52_19165 [Blattella germanica]
MYVPNKSTIHRLVGKVRETGIFADKKRNRKRTVLTEEKLDDIGACFEQSPHKSLSKLAQQSKLILRWVVMLQIKRADAAGRLGSTLVWMNVLLWWVLLATLLQKKSMMQHLAHVNVVQSQPRGGRPDGRRGSQPTRRRGGSGVGLLLRLWRHLFDTPAPSQAPCSPPLHSHHLQNLTRFKGSARQQDDRARNMTRLNTHHLIDGICLQTCDFEIPLSNSQTSASIFSLSLVANMAAKRCSGDNEAELRKMLESVLDSDCEYSEFSNDKTESAECVSSSDSSSSESSSDENGNNNDNAPGPSKRARTTTQKRQSLELD